MKTLLVGEAPGRGYEGQPAFSSASGQRLTKLLGQDVREVFYCWNLLADSQPLGNKGTKFPTGEARQSAKRLLWALETPAAKGREVRMLLAGSRVASAFKLRHWQLFEWSDMWTRSTLLLNKGAPWLHEIKYAVIPHPSGVNRWWNEPDNVERARKFLVAEAKKGE